MARETRRFRVRGEDGKIYTLVQSQEQKIVDLGFGRTLTVADKKELRLDEGPRVTRLDETTFKVVTTGQILRMAPEEP